MQNSVELIGYYGSDLTHAQSAWTSTVRDLTPDKLDRVDRLLATLAEQGHLTPFEKSSLHFLVNVDQATHIHLLKHRIGVSINGESARYKELKEDKTYLPDDWIDISYQGDDAEWTQGRGNNDWYSILRDYTNMGNLLYHQAIKDLTPLVGKKRAKESARFFKTINSQITLDIMFNWRSFVHFLKLRNDEAAQLEVRTIAAQMLQLVKNIEGNPFQHTITAFNL